MNILCATCPFFLETLLPTFSTHGTRGPLAPSQLCHATLLLFSVFSSLFLFSAMRTLPYHKARPHNTIIFLPNVCIIIKLIFCVQLENKVTIMHVTDNMFGETFFLGWGCVLFKCKGSFQYKQKQHDFGTSLLCMPNTLYKTTVWNKVVFVVNLIPLLLLCSLASFWYKLY